VRGSLFIDGDDGFCFEPTNGIYSRLIFHNFQLQKGSAGPGSSRMIYILMGMCFEVCK